MNYKGEMDALNRVQKSISRDEFRKQKDAEREARRANAKATECDDGEKLREVEKGRALPAGTKRKRKDGSTYVKQSNGSWSKEAGKPNKDAKSFYDSRKKSRAEKPKGDEGATNGNARPSAYGSKDFYKKRQQARAGKKNAKLIESTKKPSPKFKTADEMNAKELKKLGDSMDANGSGGKSEKKFLNAKQATNAKTAHSYYSKRRKK